MTEMLDLHCHILPAIDDGAQSLDESLQMARNFVKDGVRYAVATPHCHRYIHLLREQILPKVYELNRQLDSAGIALKILPGSEIQVVETNSYRREFEAGVYCHLGDGPDFTLLEFNWKRELFPTDAVQLIEWIRRQGMVPIIAHPERYEYFATEPELLAAVVAAGAWLQITVDSLLGNHGSLPRALAETQLQQYRDVVLSSDAHNLGRCSGMSAGYAWVQTHLGDDRAEDLLQRGESILQKLLDHSTAETSLVE